MIWTTVLFVLTCKTKMARAMKGKIIQKMTSMTWVSGRLQLLRARVTERKITVSVWWKSRRSRFWFELARDSEGSSYQESTVDLTAGKPDNDGWLNASLFRKCRKMLFHSQLELPGNSKHNKKRAFNITSSFAPQSGLRVYSNQGCICHNSNRLILDFFEKRVTDE